MSNLVSLEHVWDMDENGEATSLRYARGDRVAEADVKPLKKDGVRLAEEESPEWHEEFNPEASRRAVSHRANEGDEGYVRVSPEDYQALLDRLAALEGAKADEPDNEPDTKEKDVKPETKDKRGPKETPKDAPKDGDK